MNAKLLTKDEKEVLKELFGTWKEMYKNDNYQPLYAIFQSSDRPDVYKEMLFKAKLNGEEVGAKVIFNEASKLNNGSKKVFENVELGKKYNIDDLGLEL